MSDERSAQRGTESVTEPVEIPPRKRIVTYGFMWFYWGASLLLFFWIPSIVDSFGPPIVEGPDGEHIHLTFEMPLGYFVMFAIVNAFGSTVVLAVWSVGKVLMWGWRNVWGGIGEA